MAETVAQTVCTGCGYNMIGAAPGRCPFCGAAPDAFLNDRDCAAQHRVTEYPVAEGIVRLNSSPALGIEHAAYRVDTGEGAFMIDSPSAFRPELPAVDVIAFTHKDFLGASNQYRAAYGAQVWIHEADAAHPLARPFPFDRRFAGDFAELGLEAKHTAGHSPGFTVYLARGALFPCDLVFDVGARTRFNPYGLGPVEERKAAAVLCEWLEGRDVAHVCAWNYVTDYAGWKARLDQLVAAGRPVDRGPRNRAGAPPLYQCERCGLVYDPVLGLPEDGIAPGTLFGDIPDDWRCPDCRVTKADFVALD